ncbi:type II toxin-antitoxin system RelE/ParE family toxin [Sphingobium yanoikuyae]|uniref:Type II toxin-antitoxin system RelE/ParE family toxin n=1 Tax=Sphingobium yanoikuyae TaxID=13690 RepID=A0A9X7UKF2_SPHYA|nr:type II toxin-antitoxin system RelE/ParE family toxin [Sphingobium yanoikuyae]QNG48525.1 type II toxin-antitoxin system RelE/ParE family toxin [Sphingobium yanoikuyae]
MTIAYVLTAAAEEDLRMIVRYTRKQWSDAEVRSYVAKLESSIVHLATGRGAFKDMSDLHPALRMARCEHHYIFCLPRAGEPSLVVALFHERMDLMTRLQSRLA